MSMFSFILTLLVITKFPTSYNIRDIRDVNVHLHPYFLVIKFPISHIIRDTRDVNDQFHHNSSPL